jgi:hypothetical protein
VLKVSFPLARKGNILPGVQGSTTIMGRPRCEVPDMKAPPPPPPVNPALPAPPQVGLIVSATDPAWTSVIQYTMPDNDVAAIDTSTFNVTYIPHLGTENMDRRRKLPEHSDTRKCLNLLECSSDRRRRAVRKSSKRVHDRDPSKRYGKLLTG